MASQFKSDEVVNDREVLIRELSRGYELTAQLQMQALRMLREDAQADAVAFILREVSQAFTVSLSILRPGKKASAEGSNGGLACDRKAKEDNRETKKLITSSPHHDGYQWRKYGQKKITNTTFPRCYYRCAHHREHSCPARKQVQQQNNSDPPSFLVIYVHKHTCNKIVQPEPTKSQPILDFAAKKSPAPYFPVLDRGNEEVEHEALVSCLATVLRGCCSEPVISQNGSTSFRQDQSVSMETTDRSVDEICPTPTTSLSPAMEVTELDYMMIEKACFESYDLFL